MLPYQTAAVALAALLLIPSNVQSHGHLKSPRSRNYVASENGVNWMTASNPLISITPQIEVEPQSANIGGIDAQCGIIASSRNYDFPKNYNGQPLGADHQSCYATGEIIDIKIKLTAHHKGHFEVYACPIDDVSDECIGDESVECNSRPSKECFAANPLTFVSDELHGAVADEEYPVRAYLAPNVQDLHYKYKLPDGLKGDKVLIQWYYLTANSCKWEGYDEYDWDAAGWGLSYLGNVASCPNIPPDGRGVPEQFWNCAEVRILDEPTYEACAGRATTVVDIPSLNSYTGGGGSGVTTTQAPPTSIASTTGGNQGSTTTSQGGAHNYCGLTWADANDSCGQPCPGGKNSECTEGGFCFADATNCPDIYMEPNGGEGGDPSGSCGGGNVGNGICADTSLCCSQFGWCDITAEHCGAGCNSGPCLAPTTPGPTPPVTSYPTRSPNNDPPPDIAREDSRLIAYLGNWEACPTPQQLESYTHIVVAFAVSYSYNQAKNNCNAECNIGTSVQICSTQTGNEIAEWQALGKKVILSFGGAGMGGSWSGDSNNCWDDCFGREEQLSTALVSMVESQQFDGIDIDYEYCYDTENNRHFGCQQMTSKYSDAKAQFFLSEMTYLLREKLDVLGPDLELTHAPMDTDLVTDSPYYQILKTNSDKLNFLMPQFYNGITKPIYGFTSALAGRPSLDQVYSNLANDMFQNEPEKIVFGFCIDDCGATGSNTNAAQAVTVLEQVKAHNNGEFACNGGAFFWVVSDDTAWSDLVYDEVSQTTGCSSSEVTTTLAPPSSTVLSTTSQQTTSQATTSQQTTQGTTSQQTTEVTTTQAPPTSTSVASTTSSSNQSTSTEAPPSGLCSSTSHDGCTSNSYPRCGRSELDSREHCNAVCQVNTDCPSVNGVQQFCWGTHKNYCGLFPKRTYSSPVQASGLRCGFTEIHARTFCGVSCSQDSDCAFMGAGAGCHNTHSNYCGSDYTTDDSPPATTTQANTNQQTTQATTESTVVSTTSQQTTSSQTTSTEASTTSTTSGHCTSSCSTCSPYTLTELRAMGNTNWYTTQSNCDKCANGHQWWPCNVDICKCGN